MLTEGQTEGFPFFQLVLNLPCLSLEDETQNSSDTCPLVDDHNKRKWHDLSHLPLESGNGQVSNRFAIYQARTTVVISGNSNFEWFGYALGNIGPVDASPNEIDGDEDMNEPNSPDSTAFDNDPEPEEDFFATGGCEYVLNPDNIIWDPRVYFLRAIQTRFSVATQASEYLVRKLDAACPDWVILSSSWLLRR